MVQDSGRHGWEDIGIVRGGALDYASYHWANLLAGNGTDVAALQCLLQGPTLTALEDLWIGVTGAHTVRVDGRARPSWAGFWVGAGSEVSIGPTTGARAYVAVHGGIAVEPVLGSRSTDLQAGFGGYQGRALRVGDILPVEAKDGAPTSRNQVLRHPSPPSMPDLLEARAVIGPAQLDIPPAVIEEFLGSTFQVSSRSNEMGVRLDGALLPIEEAGSAISQPMPVGAIQLTPSGQPIVLLNSRGTIGGYPVLATVITPDVWRIGQARPGDRLSFRLLSVATARQIARRDYEELSRASAVLVEDELLPP